MSKTLLKYYLIILIATLSFSFSKGAESDMQFIENKGQWPSHVKFQSPLKYGNVYFENNQFSFLFFEDRNNHHEHNGQCNHNASSNETNNVQFHHYKIEFLNAQTQSIEKLSAPSEHYFNYLLGNNSETWQSHVHSFKAISYKNLYNGIDVLVQGSGENIKYDYIVSPQANVQQIQLKYWGVENMRIENGHLFYETSLVGVQEEKPYAYQIINGKKVEVACLYELNQQTQSISFSFPNGFNQHLELIIDPSLIFSRYSGSTIGNFGFTATYDNLGRAYGGGSAFGTGYPVTLGAFDETFNGGTIDMGISCYHPITGAIIYSTYIGGSNNEVPHSMIVNHAGELVVLGTTGSLDFPLSSLSSSYDNTFNGGTSANFPSNGVNYSANGADIVIVKLSNDGSTLLASTYLGGSGNDGLNDDATITSTYNGSDLNFNYGDVFRGEVMVDNFDNVYISSSSNSTNYPTLGSFSNLQGEQDAVITKLDANLSNLLFSRYLGGINDDAGYSLKINQAGDILVVGGTLSNNFPTTSGVLQAIYAGGAGDGFIAKLDTINGNILSATYLGTNNYDQVFLIELDATDNVYVVGQTLGTYPIQNASYGLANRKQFIHKLHANLSTTFYSTTFGNSTTQVDISPTALLVDICERVYVGSWGGSTNSSRNTQTTGNISGLPITSDALQATTNGGGDLYFFILDKNANGLLFGSYFGGTAAEHVDGGTSRFDAQGTIYQAVCAGCGGGTFSVSPGYSANTNPNSICNLGVIKLNLELPSTQVEVDAFPRATGCAPLLVNFESELINVSSFQWDFGDGSSSNQQFPIHLYTDTGIYYVQLIGVDSNSCNLADTAFLTVEVNDNVLYPNFTDSIVISCSSTSLSINSPQNYPATQYLWDMGDGAFYTTPSISHTYDTSGYYNITLHLADSTSCNLFDSVSYNVYLPPLFDLEISANTNNACLPYTANFLGISNSPTASYYWDFGDGNFSTQQNPSHLYSVAGNYTITFTGIDSSACNIADTTILNIEIYENAATALYGTSENWLNCDSLELTVYSLVPNASHLWSFGNGQTSIDSSATVLFTTGAYQVTYVVNDSAQFCAPIDTATFPVNILERLELAVTTLDTSSCIPLSLVFQASSNTLASTFAWDFGNGQTASTANPSITFPNVGVFNVSVIVTDSATCNISDSAFVSIETFNNQAVAAYGTLENWLNCDSLELTVYSLVSNASHLWNFGNGQTSTDSSATVLFTTGAYQVTYIVNDTAQFCAPTDSATFPINILERLEIDIITPNYSGCSPFQVNFNSNSNGSQANYYWNFGDGSFSNLMNPSKTYASGNYTAFVVVSDTGFCNANDTAFSMIQSIDAIDSATFITTENYTSCDSLVLQVQSTTLQAQFHYWDFGNGQTSNLANDSTSYGPGNYQGFYVAITNTGNCNQSDTSYFEIEVLEALNSAPQVANLKGCIPYVVDFNAGTYPVNTSYFWNFGNGQTSTLANPQFIFQNVGSFPVSLIVSNPNSCNQADTNQITIIAINDQSQASMQVDEERFACDSVVLDFQSNNISGNQFWQISDGSLYFGSSGNHTFNSFGNYSLQYILIDSSMICKVADTLTYTVEFMGVEANIVASDTMGCFPLLVDFDNLSSSATSYWWSIGNVTGTSSNLPSYNFTQSGSYTFTLVAFNPNTCNELDTLQMNIDIIDGTVNANFNAQVLHACDSLLSIELINLSWQATAYLWDFGTYTSTLENPGTVNFTEPGTYTISLYANNPNLCFGIDTISKSFTLLPNIVAKFLAEPLCLGSELNLENESTPYTSDITWDFGDGNTSSLWNANYLYENVGTYTITLQVIDSNTCNIIDTSEQIIEVLERPNAGFETDASIYDLFEEVTFTNTSSLFEEVLWLLGDGTSSDETNQLSHTFLDIRKYNNCILASNIACKDTFCDEITIDYNGIIGVPNAFSPNNDGVNDVVFVEGNGIMQLNFRIYNRWGELVFQSYNQNDGWNGITRGVAQEMEVYTYIVDAILADGTNPVLKGNITLLR